MQNLNTTPSITFGLLYPTWKDDEGGFIDFCPEKFPLISDFELGPLWLAMGISHVICRLRRHPFAPPVLKLPVLGFPNE